MTGIGPRAHLASVGIKVKVDLPVGDNFHDHMGTFVFFSTDAPSLSNPLITFSPLNIANYIATRNNNLSTNFIDAVSFIKTKFVNQTDDWPDVQFHFLSLGIIMNLLLNYFIEYNYNQITF